MKIAVLGWGSLLWDPRDLKFVRPWAVADLSLPLEFSRKSSGERLTLVIDPEHGRDVPVAFAVSGYRTLPGAIRNLSTRERCNEADIGVAKATGRTHARLPLYGERIRAWATSKGFDAAIWADLGPKFEGFTLESAVGHLGGPKSRSLNDARTYISLAPAMVDTPLSEHLRSLGWLLWSNTQPATRGNKRQSLANRPTARPRRSRSREEQASGRAARPSTRRNA